MAGRDLNAVIGKAQKNSEKAKDGVEKRAHTTITSEDEKKEGRSMSFKRKNIKKAENFVRKFNYENGTRVSLSEVIDTLIETSIDSKDLEKVLMNRL